jgi:hypothetical protein
MAVLVAGLAAGPRAWAQTASGDIVCWNDDHGVRACGDHVPPEFARKQREIYDPRGVLVKTLKAEQTPEQRAEEERRERETERAQEQIQQRLQNDQFMLQTYKNLGELKSMRDDRLQTFEVRIDLAEKAVREGSASLKDLQDRADEERGGGRDPSPQLLAQIKGFESLQAENIRTLARIKLERDSVAAQFERDIQRYQQLQAAATPAAPPTPLPPLPPLAPPPVTAPRP